MASNAVARRVEIETKQDIGEDESKQVTSAKALASEDHMSVGIEVKQDMSATVADTKAYLFLDKLQVDVTGIVVMICRKWDVNAVMGRYLSTDFVVSDAKGNAIHCTARSNVAHNFLRLKEGGIYSIKNFVVHHNKEEYRIPKNDSFMIEFDGATSIRKAFVKADGFVRYCNTPILTNIAAKANLGYYFMDQQT
ncbi:reverse transcriptase domain-containing protein [Tanacetum coccineum]|uniref:Reverse transcriptase domain-containing protein n=1 Tax=Tanacetum coccineum TaxID=301880 RepID=A0ABQ5GY16_9ASTR